MRRVAWIVVMALAGGLLVEGTALAAEPPPNDTASTAIRASMGYSQSLDTTAATADDEEHQLVVQCDEFPFGGVWYTFLGTGERVDVDASGSDYVPAVFIGTGAPGNLELTNCFGAEVSHSTFNSEPGVLYYVLIVDLDSFGGIGGAMHVEFKPGVPVPTVTFTLAWRGHLTARGAARVHGTYTCANADAVRLWVTVQQRRAGHLIGPAEKDKSLPAVCDGRPHKWSAVAGIGYDPATESFRRVTFKPGRASVAAGVDVCSVFCASAGAGHRVFLRR